MIILNFTNLSFKDYLLLIEKNTDSVPKYVLCKRRQFSKRMFSEVLLKLLKGSTQVKLLPEPYTEIPDGI